MTDSLNNTGMLHVKSVKAHSGSDSLCNSMNHFKSKSRSSNYQQLNVQEHMDKFPQTQDTCNSQRSLNQFDCITYQKNNKIRSQKINSKNSRSFFSSTKCDEGKGMVFENGSEHDISSSYRESFQIVEMVQSQTNHGLNFTNLTETNVSSFIQEKNESNDNCQISSKHREKILFNSSTDGTGTSQEKHFEEADIFKKNSSAGDDDSKHQKDVTRGTNLNILEFDTINSTMPESFESSHVITKNLMSNNEETGSTRQENVLEEDSSFIDDETSTQNEVVCTNLNLIVPDSPESTFQSFSVKETNGDNKNLNDLTKYQDSYISNNNVSTDLGSSEESPFVKISHDRFKQAFVHITPLKLPIGVLKKGNFKELEIQNHSCDLFDDVDHVASEQNSNHISTVEKSSHDRSKLYQQAFVDITNLKLPVDVLRKENFKELENHSCDLFNDVTSEQNSNHILDTIMESVDTNKLFSDECRNGRKSEEDIETQTCNNLTIVDDTLDDKASTHERQKEGLMQNVSNELMDLDVSTNDFKGFESSNSPSVTNSLKSILEEQSLLASLEESKKITSTTNAKDITMESVDNNKLFSDERRNLQKNTCNNIIIVDDTLDDKTSTQKKELMQNVSNELMDLDVSINVFKDFESTSPNVGNSILEEHSSLENFEQSKKITSTPNVFAIPNLTNMKFNNKRLKPKTIDLDGSTDELKGVSSKIPPVTSPLENLTLEKDSSPNFEHSKKITPKLFALPKAPAAKCIKRKMSVLKPGKSWRRSLLEVRKANENTNDNRLLINGCVSTCLNSSLQNLELATPRRQSIRIVPISSTIKSTQDGSVLENYAMCKSYISDALHEKLLEEYFENLSLTGDTLGLTLREPNLVPVVTAKEIVLRRCGQTEPLPFKKCYPNTLLHNCQKIGEGVYGEVFLYRNQHGSTTVMKIIPIEGIQMVNGERQKKFDEILSEIIIAMELSNLRHNETDCTSGFSNMGKIRCVQGKYPNRLLELWELYEESRGSENDSPVVFTDDQLYIIMEFANGGKDIEAFVFNNAQQAYSIFMQVACALAIAERRLEFEHRDLHWGNILVANVERNKTISYVVDGKEITLDTNGVEATIIDFTLSRITYDGVCIYNDLSLEPDLFTGHDDYQFDIYRLMQEHNGNKWQQFVPYTNVLWLHYLLDKMTRVLRYKYKNTKIHKNYIRKLNEVRAKLLDFKSAGDILNFLLNLDK